MSGGVPTAIVVIGGEPPRPEVVAHLPGDATVIAADSGLDHALSLGLTIDLLVGDMDSVSAEALETARTAGIPMRPYPTDKDATDTELALDAAVAMGCERIVVVSGGGDRFDHLLGTVSVIAAPRAGVAVSAWIGPDLVHLVHGHDRVDLDVAVGSTLSLIALGGPAAGIITEGLRWPLHDEELRWGSARGVSNEVLTSPVSVTVTQGTLAVIVPHHLEATEP